MPARRAFVCRTKWRNHTEKGSWSPTSAEYYSLSTSLRQVRRVQGWQMKIVRDTSGWASEWNRHWTRNIQRQTDKYTEGRRREGERETERETETPRQTETFYSSLTIFQIPRVYYMFCYLRMIILVIFCVWCIVRRTLMNQVLEHANDWFV